jgi:hypothetical protein
MIYYNQIGHKKPKPCTGRRMRAVFEGGPKPVPPGHKSFKDSSFLLRRETA